MAGDDDDAVRPFEVAERGGEAMDAGDADVLVHVTYVPEQLGADLCFSHDRPVRGAAGDDHDEARVSGQRPRRPTRAGRVRPAVRPARPAQRGRAASVGTRHEHARPLRLRSSR